MAQCTDLSKPINKRIILLLPLLLLGVLLVAGCGGGGSTTPASFGGGGTVTDDLSGRITDSTGAPVVGALVELLPEPAPVLGKVMAQKEQDYQDTTDQDGRYGISGFPPGLYQLQVNAPGQMPWGADLDLSSGEFAVQDAQLWPPAGQAAVFQSMAEDLIPVDTADRSYDVYLAQAEGGIEKISNPQEGQNGKGSGFPVMSDSNRFVVFESMGQLVPEDQNDWIDVYRFDRETGTMTCLTAGQEFHEGYCEYGETNPFTSGDGVFTVFEWNMGSDEDKRIFLHDAQTGEITQVSRALDQDEALNGCSKRPVVSAYGRYVAFDSAATNLVVPPVPRRVDGAHRNIFVFDRMTETTIQASVGAGPETPNNCSQWPSLSADGRLVAFRSNATNLVTPQPPAGMIYVRNLVANTTTLVSVDSAGNPASNYCYRPVISGNGRYVAFYTNAPLVPEDTNEHSDIYLRDLQEGTTTLVSWNEAGTNGGNGWSDNPVLSFDGTYALFRTRATDLVTGGAPSTTTQVYVRRLLDGLSALVSHTPAMTPGDGDSDTRSSI